MMKKTLLPALLAALLLTMTGCSRPTNQEYYEQAQLYLGSGECEHAAMLFSQLGEYEDSAEYALYCAGLAALEEGELALARTNLNAVHPFKSSGRYLTYLDALEKEAAGDMEAALALFESLGSFEDSRKAAETLRTKIPEAAIEEGRRLMAAGEYAAARELFLSLDGYGQSETLAKNCTTALNKAAYSEADALFDSGDLAGAMRAFAALGDVLDAPARAAECARKLHAALDSRYEAVTLETAGALMEAYAALGDETALARVEALEARYGLNLSVLAAAQEQPYVLLGTYPMGESGVESSLLWRVLRAEEGTLTLLCESVIDASPVATRTSLMLTDEEAQAVSGSTLPALADLASLSDLTCSATPYALAQGAAHAEGAALYWLRDSLESGIHPVVGGAGSLVIPADGVTPGIRPMITLSLHDFTFTAGSGTQEDPFR